MSAAIPGPNNLSPARERHTPNSTPHSPWWATEDLAEAAGALLDAARGLVADLDPEAQPRSAAAARQLLVACAGLFMDAQEGCA